MLLPSGLPSLSGCHCWFSGQLRADRLLLDTWWPQCLPSAHLQVWWGWTKTPQFIPPVLSYYCYACMSFSFLPFANSPGSCSYLLHPPPHHSGFVKYFSVMFLQPEAISTFTSEPALISFAKFFCKTSEDNNFVSSDIEIDLHECSWNDFPVRS